MWETAFGWYIAQILGGKYTNIVFRRTLAAGEIDTLITDDAVNSASLKAALSSGALLLFDVSSYSTGGVVALDVKPDGLETERFTVDALPAPIHRLIQPPKKCDAGIEIAYENGGVPTSMVLNFGAIQFTDSQMDKFSKIAEGVADLSYANKNLILESQQLQQILMALVNLTSLQQGKGLVYPVSGEIAAGIGPQRCRG